MTNFPIVATIVKAVALFNQWDIVEGQTNQFLVRFNINHRIKAD